MHGSRPELEAGMPARGERRGPAEGLVTTGMDVSRDRQGITAHIMTKYQHKAQAADEELDLDDEEDEERHAEVDAEAAKRSASRARKE